MDHRTHEGQMEFSWNNGIGPVDPQSPWQNAHTPSQPRQQAEEFGRKRTHDIFNSPSKSNGIGLRAPASNSSFLFSSLSQPPGTKSPTRPSSPTKSLPPIPISNNPAFTTPRINRSETNYDSSEVEASPEGYNADSDATPEMGLRSEIAKMKAAFSSNSPERKNPALARVTGSTSRREILKPYSHKAENRIKKNRSRELKRWAMGRSSSRTDYEDDQKAQQEANTGSGVVASFFSFLHAHPNLPHIMSWWAMFILNGFWVSCLITLIWVGWSTLKSDVNAKVEEAVKVLSQEIEDCLHKYQANQCDRSTRLPYLESVCNNWEICKNRDPYRLSRSQVSAKTFAEAFNSLIEPISWKTMMFTAVIYLGFVYFSNLALTHTRKNTAPLPPPPTPSQAEAAYRQQGNGQDFYPGFQPQTPRFQQQQYAGGLDMGSPVRRLEF